MEDIGEAGKEQETEEEVDSDEEADFEPSSAANGSPEGNQPSETLSEPGYAVADTQDIFQGTTQHVDLSFPLPENESDDRPLSRHESIQPLDIDTPSLKQESDDEDDLFLREPTQVIDFEVPPPDGGFKDEDTGAEASSESGSTITEVYDPRPPREGTQAILRGQTMAPNFEIPEPEGGWDHAIPSLPPSTPRSPVAEIVVSDIDAQLEAWIDANTTAGITVDDGLAALKCTSMNTELAERVLQSVRKTKKIPENQRGVWTEIDDEDLEATDARKIERIKLKHGENGLEARWDFLNYYRSL